MHYLKRQTKKNGEEGVSPVIGVMLMLVVTIIIAAVVSAFAGGAVSGSQKAPSASVEIHIRNGGDNSSSYFTMKVLGVNDPIPTKNLRLITSWTTTNKNTTSTDYGNPIIGGNTTSAGRANVYIPGELVSSNAGGMVAVPTGYGNGVTNWSNDTYHPQEAQWGYFPLYSGTTTYDKPTIYENYQYSSSGTLLDPMQAILGGGWNNLRRGDVVTVRILDAPSGKIIVDQNVIVEG